MYRPAFFLGSLKRQATSRGIWTSRKAASSNAIPPDLAGVNISPAFDLTCLGGEDVLDGRSLRNQETKATGLEGMGRQVLTYCRSSGRLAQPMTMLALGTLKRTFSSMREGDPHISQLIDEYLNEDEDGSGFSLEGGVMMIHFNPIIKEAPLIRHLLCIDEHDIMSQSWFPLIDCLVKGGAILKPISPTGLMRPQDVLRSGGYETGNLGFHLIRQGSRLIAANLMRGINVSELMNLESILWSPNLRCLMFCRPHLVGDNEGASCPYKPLHETIDAGVKLTTGCSLDNLPYPLPVYLDHFLSYLLNASSTDKRLITNHTATLFPGERIHRNMERNHVLRQRLPYEFGKTGRKRARKVFAELAVVFVGFRSMENKKFLPHTNKQAKIYLLDCSNESME